MAQVKVTHNIENTQIALDAAEIPNLDASKITSGDIAAARLNNATVDLQPIKSDISALALREATNESSAAFNLPNQFIDTFTDDTNLGTQTDGDRTNGYWSTSGETSDSLSISWNQRASFSIYYARSGSGGATYNSTGNSSSETITNLLTGQDGESASGFSEQAVAYYHTYVFDLGASTTFVPTHMDYYFQDGASGFTHIKTQGFNTVPGSGNTDPSDLVTFTTRSSITNGTSYTDTISTSTKFRYLAWQKHYSGGNNYSNLHSMRWRGTRHIVTNNATGTLIQSANTVGSAKTKVGGTMLYKDNAGTATLGTDLKIYFTCNGGTNWTEATSYSAITPVYSTGIKQVRLGETTCTSGTDIRYKAVWANQASGSKETQLHGIGTNY